MEVLDIIKKRYAAKLFTGQKIPPEDFEKIVESIRLAPSSFNLQPWKVKVVRDKETLEKLEKASFGQKQIGTCSDLLVFCAMKDLGENKDKLISEMKKNIPEEKFMEYEKMLGDYFSNTSSEDLFRLSERENFMALENAILCATELGYQSCPMGGFEAEKYKEILELDGNLVPVVILPIGIPADKQREKFRFSKEEIIL